MRGAVRLALTGARATITLDRPDKLNALTVADLEAFAAALGEVHAAPAVRVLVVTGAGARAFSSGVSLGDVAGADWSDNPLTALCDGLEQFPLPTVCALNGGVWGGGAEIALACDFRIGVEGMVCAVPPARLGGQVLVDGGYSDIAPVDVARAAGAEVVIVVDPSDRGIAPEPANGIDALLRAIEICQNEHAHLRFKDADLVLRPSFPLPIGTLDFRHRRLAIAAGIRATRRARAEIDAVLARR